MDTNSNTQPVEVLPEVRRFLAKEHGIFVEDRICLGLLVVAGLFFIFSLVREIQSTRATALKAAA